jgi:hypothetical protein
VLFLCLCTSFILICTGQILNKLGCAILGCHMFKKNLVLSSDTDCGSNINFSVELFMPLFVGKIILGEAAERSFLFVHCSVRVLVFSLG